MVYRFTETIFDTCRNEKKVINSLAIMLPRISGHMQGDGTISISTTYEIRTFSFLSPFPSIKTGTDIF